MIYERAFGTPVDTLDIRQVLHSHGVIVHDGPDLIMP